MQKKNFTQFTVLSDLNSQETINSREFPQTKRHLCKPPANIIFIGERLNISSNIRNNAMCLICNILLMNIALDVLVSSIRQEKEIKVYGLERRGKGVLICTQHD